MVFIDKVSISCNICYMDKLKEQQYEDTAKLLKVLGHPMRLAMVSELREKQWCVCELAAQLGLNKSAASKHLALLKQVGIIDMDKEGTRVNCTLVMPCVFDMMRCVNPKEAVPTVAKLNHFTSGCSCSSKEDR